VEKVGLLRRCLFWGGFLFDLECRVRVCINRWDAVVPPIVDGAVDVDLNESTFAFQNSAEYLAFAVNNLVESLTDSCHGFC